MNLIGIKIWNFLSIGHVERDLAGQGLVVLVGENQDDPATDSNGSGKSSLPEAIVWCLYGRTMRGIKTDAVINRQIGKGCRVELDLTVEQGRLQIRRCRKDQNVVNDKGEKEPNQFRIWLNGKDVSSNDPKVTQPTLVGLLGMNYDQFTRLVIIGQGFDNKFSTMSDRELKEFIEERTGSVHYARAYDLANAELGATQGQKKGLDSNRNMLQQGLADLRRRLVEAEKVCEEQIAARDDQVKHLELTLGIQKQALAERSAELGVFNTNRLAKQSESEAALGSLAQEQEALRQRHGQEISAGEAEKAELIRAFNEASAQRNQEEASLQQQRDAALAEPARQRAELVAFQPTTPVPPGPTVQASVVRYQLQQLNVEVATIQNNKPCPTCGEPLSEANRGARLAQKEAEAEAKLKELAQAEAQEKAVINATAAREAETQANNERIRQFDEQVNALHQQWTETLEAFALTTKTLQGQHGLDVAEIDKKYGPARQRQLQEVAEVDVRINAVHSGLREALTEVDTNIRRLQEVIRAAESQISASQNQISLLGGQDFNGQVLDLQTQIENNDKQISDLTAAIAELEHREYCLTYVVTAFGLTGIRSFMLDNVLTFLNERLREHCGYLFDGHTQIAISPTREKKKGGATQKITLEVHTDGGSYHASSGGERRKVDVALFLAFRDLNRMLSPVQINLEAYDEILSFLDGESASRVVTLLLEDNTVDTKILITHRTDIPIVGRYKTWKAVKQNGMTSYFDAA